MQPSLELQTSEERAMGRNSEDERRDGQPGNAGEGKVRVKVKVTEHAEKIGRRKLLFRR
jgi:hypothetical protein